MKTCPFCKGLIGDGTIVCSKCGKDVTISNPPVAKINIFLRSTDGKQEFRATDHSIIIRHFGILGQPGSTTEIPLNQIIKVSIIREPRGNFSPGVIEIKIAGGLDEIVHLTPFLSVGSGNCIKLFYDTAYQKAAWDLQQHIISYQSPKQNTAQTPAAVPSPADEIRKYKELLDMGAITQDEFELKKKQLLGL